MSSAEEQEQSVSQPQVHEEQRRAALRSFRDRFDREYGRAVNKFVPLDVRRLQRQDWWPTMFLARYDFDVDVAFPVFIECLKWRREFGVNEISILQLKPHLEKQVMYMRGQDKLGRPIFWLNVRNHRKDADLIIAQTMITFWLERHCFESKGQQLVIVFDMYKTGLQNMDLDLIKFLLHSLKFYYPGLLAYLLTYDIPFILNAAWRVVRSWLDPAAQKKIIFTNKETVQEYISENHLPLHMDGTDEYQFGLEQLGASRDQQETLEEADDSDSSGSGNYESDTEAMTAEYLNRDFEYKMALESKVEYPRKRTVKFAEDCDATKQNGVPPSMLAAQPSPTAVAHENMLSPAAEPRDNEPSTATQQSTPLNSSRMADLSADERRIQQQKMKQLTLKTKDWMDFRLSNMYNSCYEGSFLVVSPKEELSFQSIPGEQDRVEVIVLKNTGQLPSIFKIKTTSPEKFRVRPSSGHVGSGEKLVVRIYLQAGYQDTVSKEKFLVTAIQVQSLPDVSSPEKITEMWKSCPKEALFEHRLTCRVSSSPSRIILPPAHSSNTADAQHTMSSEEDLGERMSRLRLENRVIMALLVTIFCLMFVLLFYQRSTYRSLSARLDHLGQCHKQM